MNEIIVSLHPDDRDRLDAIIVALGRGLEALATLTGREDVKMSAPGPDVDFPWADEALPFPQPTAPAADPAPAPMSLPEFQKILTTRAAESAATKQKVRDLINRYAPSVSEIPEDKRAEVLAALAEI